MDHEPIMTRHVLVMIVILACGLVPDRLAGDGPSRLRDSFKSNLFNRADLERIERGYYEQLLDQGRRLDDLADVPGLRIRRRSGSTWSIPVDQSPLVMRVDDLREVVLEAQRRHRAIRPALAHQRPGHARPELLAREAGRDLPDRPGGRLDRRRLGSQRRGPVRVDPGRSSGTSVPAIRAGGKVEIINCAVPGHSPGQRWYHFGQVGWPMEPDLVIYESTAADVGWDERRLRFLLARGLGWDCPIYRAALANAGVAAASAAPTSTSGPSSPGTGTSSPGVYQTMAADCRARGVPIVWVLVPRVGRKSDAGRAARPDRDGTGRGLLADRRPDRRLRRPRSRPAWPSTATTSIPTPRPCPARPAARPGPESDRPSWAGSGGPRSARLSNPATAPGHDSGGRLVDESGSTGGLPRRSGRAITMKSPESGSVSTARIGIVQSLLLLVVAIFPWPAGWDRVRGAVDSARSPELNRAEREGHAAGYYEGLIGGKRRRGRIARRSVAPADRQAERLGPLPAKPTSSTTSTTTSSSSSSSRCVERTLFGQPFRPTPSACTTTRSRSRSPRERSASPCSARRWTWAGACGTRRPTSISSKTGWTHHAATASALATAAVRGAQLRRRRLQPDAAARGASPQGPGVSSRPGDLLGDHARHPADGDPPLRHAPQERRPEVRLRPRGARRARRIDADDVRLDRDGELINKDRLKRKLRPHYWWLYDVTLGAIAAECRAAGVPLVMVIIPRVGKADAPSLRAEPVARLKALASHHGLTVFDLSDTFDQLDPAKLEIAAWDDHPNALGHHRLFLALARALVKDQEVYRLLFSPPRTTRSTRAPAAQTLAGEAKRRLGAGWRPPLRCERASPGSTRSWCGIRMIHSIRQ